MAVVAVGACGTLEDPNVQGQVVAEKAAESTADVLIGLPCPQATPALPPVIVTGRAMAASGCIAIERGVHWSNQLIDATPPGRVCQSPRYN